MPNLNPEIFRAYDIRGIADKDLTRESMKIIGQAIGTYMGKSCLAVGRDCRIHGERLAKAFIEGLLSTGCNVTDIGLATSPMLYWTVCKYEFNGGMAITASHNPKEYNGVKIVGKDAHSICGEKLQNIFKIAQKGEFNKGNGKLTSRNIFNDYKKEILSKVNLARPLKVTIDAGNGTTGAFVKNLFEEAGCSVTELYCELDGTFPNHEANPESEKNLADLSAKVTATGSDIGIGFDGDGDRIGLVDENGRFYSADYLLIMLGRDLLDRKPGETVIFDIKTSKIVENDIIERGGKPLRYKTGHSFIETKMRDCNALLAGECSGHMFIGENYYGFDDAFLAALKILEILSKSDKPFSEHFTDLPRLLTTPEIKLPCADNVKFQVVDALVKDFQREHKTLTLDGAFVEFGEKTWGAVRCSNTTPCLTLRFEAETLEELEKIKKIFIEKMEKHPEIRMNSIL